VIDEYADELRDRQADAARRDKHAVSSNNAPPDELKHDAEDFFKNDVKVKGDERALVEYDRIKQELADRLAPKPPVAETHVEETHNVTVAPTETFTAIPDNGPPQPPAKPDETKLSKDEITNIQKQLKALHFNVDVTGEIDHKTQIAFRAFTWDLQALAAKNGKDVSVNGVYDAKTAAAVASMPAGDLKIPSTSEDTRFHRRAVRAGETDAAYSRSLIDAAKAMNLTGGDNKVKDLSQLAVPASSSSTTAAYNNNASTEAIRERTLLDFARPLIHVSGPVKLSTLIDRFGERNFDGMKNRQLAEFEKKASDTFNSASGSDMLIHHRNRADLTKALEEINKRGNLGASEAEIKQVVNQILRQETPPATHPATTAAKTNQPPAQVSNETNNTPVNTTSSEVQTQTIDPSKYAYYGWERPTR